MTAKILLNPEATLAGIKERINAELLDAAEPVVQRALADVEREMRKRLAVHLVALLDRSFEMHSASDRLTIVMNRPDGGKA